jgi:ankyrin repeat protein
MYAAAIGATALWIYTVFLGGLRDAVSNDDTKIAVALFSGDAETIREYVRNHADVITEKDTYGSTLLHYVAASGHAEIVELMVSAGADVNAENENQETPLHWATRRKHLEAGKMLVATGANVNAKNDEGETPLHIAAAGCDADLVGLLVAAGADVNARNKVARTPLLLTMFTCVPEDVETFLISVGGTI